MGIGEAAVDAGVAVLVGVVAATVVLVILSVVQPLQDWREAVSVVAARHGRGLVRPISAG